MERTSYRKWLLLRDAVGWRSYGQRNPLFEYKDEAYEFFQTNSTNNTTFSYL